MPRRPAGRPKSPTPKDVRVTVRLTEQEAEILERMAGGVSLAATIRSCLTQVLQQRRQSLGSLPDTPQALIRRERRKARRADTLEAAALEPLFALDEPTDTDAPSGEETAEVPVIDAHGRSGTIRVTRRLIT